MLFHLLSAAFAITFNVTFSADLPTFLWHPRFPHTIVLFHRPLDSSTVVDLLDDR
jgi:hypothetical protein